MLPLIVLPLELSPIDCPGISAASVMRVPPGPDSLKLCLTLEILRNLLCFDCTYTCKFMGITIVIQAPTKSPHFGPQEKSLSASFPGQERKKGTHIIFFGADFGVKGGLKRATLGHKRFIVFFPLVMLNSGNSLEFTIAAKTITKRTLYKNIF